MKMETAGVAFAVISVLRSSFVNIGAILASGKPGGMPPLLVRTGARAARFRPSRPPPAKPAGGGRDAGRGRGSGDPALQGVRHAAGEGGRVGQQIGRAHV